MKGFVIGMYVYKPYKKQAIVSLCPYFRVNDEDENYAYSFLLLHHVWAASSIEVGEQYLLHVPHKQHLNLSAVEKLQYVKDHNILPKYAQRMYYSTKHSQDMLDDVHIPSDPSDEVNSYENIESSLFFNEDSDNDDNDEDNYIVAEIKDMQPYESQSSVQNTSTSFPDGVHKILSLESKTLLKQYVSSIQTSYLSHYESLNCINDAQQPTLQSNQQSHKFVHRYPNHTNLVEEFERGYSSCSPKQKESIDQIKIALDSSMKFENREQLIMFVSGPGGTGKSYIIKLGQLLAKITVGKTKGIFGPSVTLAATGSAANNIGGFTIQSALNMGRSGIKTKKAVSPEVGKAVGSKLNGTEVIFIDEVSLLSLEFLCKLHLYLVAARLGIRVFTQEESDRNIALSKLPFGGFHIVFTGDFYQLPPVMGIPLFLLPNTTPEAINGKRLWSSVNYFVDLVTNFRFSNAEESLLAAFLAGITNTNHNL
jgi:hypothetical protein